MLVEASFKVTIVQFVVIFVVDCVNFSEEPSASREYFVKLSKPGFNFEAWKEQ